MRLSIRRKTLSDFFVPFLESSSNFTHFEKKMIFIATLFPKLQTVKNMVGPLSKKHRSRTPFEFDHVIGSQTLVKGA